MLRDRDLTVVCCSTGAEALAVLDREPADVVISDVTLPDMTGLALLETVGNRWPGLPVVMLAADASVPQAVAALKAGAADFAQKPLKPEELGYVIDKALTVVRRGAEQPPPPPPSARVGLIGTSSAMRKVYATLKSASQSTATVLIRGESGTGKEMVARAVHEGSFRAQQPFIKIDCGSLPEQLLESELFGYERGAFTGAVARKPGRAELAHQGTLFLDEIGELSLALQAKLLRLLQDRVIERLGGTKPIPVDIRVVAATHRDLDAMIERGQFRHDLFYRLNVVPLWLPPLRARREDIEGLVQHFLTACASASRRRGTTMTADAVRLLRAQRWPGNVRQLQNFIERLVVLSSERVIGESDVRQELSQEVRFVTQPGTASAVDPSPDPGSLAPASAQAGHHQTDRHILPLELQVREAEKLALERALQCTNQNRSEAARLLSISRSTLYLKLKEHGLL